MFNKTSAPCWLVGEMDCMDCGIPMCPNCDPDFFYDMHKEDQIMWDEISTATVEPPFQLTTSPKGHTPSYPICQITTLSILPLKMSDPCGIVIL